MIEAVEAVYATHQGPGEIRRVNINAAPLSHEDFCRLKPSGIGTYQVFQETYHRPTYARPWHGAQGRLQLAGNGLGPLHPGGH